MARLGHRVAETGPSACFHLRGLEVYWASTLLQVREVVLGLYALQVSDQFSN
jgi:hypothetical protein